MPHKDNDNRPVGFQYRKNAYVCAAGHTTITVDRDRGTTPFIIPCPRCKADAQSKFYRVDQASQPTHEWYYPTVEAELPAVLAKYGIHQRGAIVEHVKMFGLLLREIGKPT